MTATVTVAMKPPGALWLALVQSRLNKICSHLLLARFFARQDLGAVASVLACTANTQTFCSRNMVAII
jgi:hypothetical protein